MTPEIRNLLKEARTIIRTHARWTAKDWDERATKALANPPQRTWVGLTDMERQMIINKHDGVAWETTIAIEQQLKEKNA
jgi:hypothetical protein